MIKTLRKIGNSTGIVLDKATLELAGLREGDRINVTVNSGSVILSPAEHVADDASFQAATRRVMDKRRELLKRLA